MWPSKKTGPDEHIESGLIPAFHCDLEDKLQRELDVPAIAASSDPAEPAPAWLGPGPAIGTTPCRRCEALEVSVSHAARAEQTQARAIGRDLPVCDPEGPAVLARLPPAEDAALEEWGPVGIAAQCGGQNQQSGQHVGFGPVFRASPVISWAGRILGDPHPSGRGYWAIRPRYETTRPKPILVPTLSGFFFPVTRTTNL